MKKQSLIGKKILVTAGPTWVPIDGVRIMTSIFTGTTGCLLAKELAVRGAKVTLLLGPGKAEPPSKSVVVKRFKYFDELQKSVRRELTMGNYDAVIHSAAVSDYKMARLELRKKISSAKKHLTLTLIPTPKIADSIKRYDQKVFLVKFKLELAANLKKLVEIGFRSMKKSDADLMVANSFDPRKKIHRTVILDKDGRVIKLERRERLAPVLLDLVAQRV